MNPPQSAHCDPLVIHEPGACRFCDDIPAAQAQRMADGVNFTGCADPNLRPDPAAQRRPLAVINRWPGNRAQQR